MCFTWLDLISLLADSVTIIGVPVLARSTWNLYKEAKQARTLKGIGEDCLNFYDVSSKCKINLVPFRSAEAIPRAGDIISLPGETNKEKTYGAGRYKVVSVEFYYREDRKSDRSISAMVYAIEVRVEKFAD